MPSSIQNLSAGDQAQTSADANSVVPFHRVDVSVAVEFLRLFDPDGFHHLCHMPVDGGSPTGRIFPPGAWDDMRAFLENAPPNVNHYFSVNEPAADTPAFTPKCSKAQIARVRAVAVDLDLDKSKPLEDARTEVEFKAFVLVPRPSLIVDSGGGMHAYWRLDEKLPADASRDLVEALGRSAAHMSEGDPQTFNLDRILALPGTVKFPNASKRAHGRRPERVAVRERGAARYALAQLATAFPPIGTGVPKSSASPDAVNILVRQWQGLVLERDTGDVTEFDDLDRRFSHAREADPKLDAIGRRDPAGLLKPEDITGSEWHYALAARLVERGFGPDDFVRLCLQLNLAEISTSPQKYDPYDTRGAERLARTWLNAEANARKFRRVADHASCWLDVGDSPAGDIEPRQRRGIDWIDPAAWEGQPIPEREWLVDNLIPFGEVVGLYGEGGLGKSLLAQQLCVSCSTGTPFLGRKTRRVRVMALFCEDDKGELQRRHGEVLTAYGLAYSSTSGQLRITSRKSEDNPLGIWNSQKRAMEVSPLWNDLEREAKEFGAGLIILDTLGDIFAGNENDRAEVTSFMTRCINRLAEDVGATVLLLAHPSTSGARLRNGQSGSTAWNGKFRARLSLTKGAGENDRRLTIEKANYGPAGGVIKIRRERGIFWTAENLWLDASPLQIVPQFDDAAEQAVAAALAELNGEKLSTAPNSGYFAPKVLKARASMLTDFSFAEVRAAFNRLQSRGLINEIEGRRERNGHKIKTVIVVSPPPSGVSSGPQERDA